MSTSIQRYEEPLDGLTQWRPPESVLAEAKQAADALTRVISLKKNPVKFNGETYLEFEDWQTCAKFYGVTAKVEKTAYVEYGNVRGFEATAVAVDRNGAEISRAESLCLNDEENWGMVPKYEWQDELDENGKKIWVDGKDGKKRPKGKRVLIGEIAKPLFQLKSMAQTRACSKVLRQVFAWIVVLAGYRPTPAEEMTGNEQFEEREDRKPHVTQPSRASDKKPEPAQQTQAAASEKGKMVETSGVIENAKQGGNGMLWLTIKSHKLLVCVPADKIDGDMAAGAFIKFRGSIWNNPKIGDYWQLDGLIELQKVQEGEVVKDQPEKKLAPDAAAVADEMFGDKPQGQAAVAGMVENGTLKPASALPAQQTEATKPGTVGLKRAKRLHTLISQNHKTTGFTEAECYKMLSALPNALQHMRDIEIDMYPTFERYATGEEDWKEFWKD